MWHQTLLKTPPEELRLRKLVPPLDSLVICQVYTQPLILCSLCDSSSILSYDLPTFNLFLVLIIHITNLNGVPLLTDTAEVNYIPALAALVIVSIGIHENRRKHFILPPSL